MELMNRIEDLLEKNESAFTLLVEKLETKNTLHEKLQKKLSELKDTPIAEPEINKIISTGTKMDLAKKLLSVEEIVNDFSAKEVGDFIYAVEQKITSLQDEDGVFKSTPNTENCNLPNFIEVDELMRFGEKEVKLREKFKNAKTQKEKDKIEKEKEKLTKESRKKTLEISGLDIEVLTEWEELLVTSQVYRVAIDATMSSVGKQ